MECININKSFGEKIIFHQWSATLPEGKFIALMGPSGRGKTTLLRMMAGLEDYEGEMILPKKKAFIFQESNFLEHLSLKKNLEIVRIRENPLPLAKKLGLEKDLHRPVKNFSGGMKRRASILRLLLSEADLYLMDEPFKELDAKNYKKTMLLVKETLTGKNVVFSTHREEEIKALEASVLYL